MKIEEYDFSIMPHISWVYENKNGFTDGCVATPHGIVKVYAQGGGKNFYVTNLNYVIGGRLFVRQFRGKRYSPRGIATKAKQFAKEVYEKHFYRR